TLENSPQRRYQHASEIKTDVENISGIMEKLPPSVQRMLGHEYRSKLTIFGLPLVHIASGIDPTTGKKRIARGIIAIGDIAQGGVAIGGVAFGGLVFGGLGVGVISLSGLAVGLLTFGGGSIGLIFAYGGLAIAPIAFGGLAYGYYAFGGAAFGTHALGGNAHDPLAQEFFQQWKLNAIASRLNTVTLSLIAVTILISTGVTWLTKRMAAASMRKS